MTTLEILGLFAIGVVSLQLLIILGLASGYGLYILLEKHEEKSRKKNIQPLTTLDQLFQNNDIKILDLNDRTKH